MSIPIPMALDVDQLTKNQESEDSATEKGQSDDESFYSYESPSSDEDEYFNSIDNHQVCLDDHLTRHQRTLADLFELENYQRSKRSNKQLKFKRHRSKNEIQKVKCESHCQSTNVHHRLVKKYVDKLLRRYHDHYSKHSVENSRSDSVESRIVQNRFQSTSKPKQCQLESSPVVLPVIPPAIRQFTIDHQTVAGQVEFDDQMIAFLIEMQNRDL